MLNGSQPTAAPRAFNRIPRRDLEISDVTGLIARSINLQEVSHGVSIILRDRDSRRVREEVTLIQATVVAMFTANRIVKSWTAKLERIGEDKKSQAKAQWKAAVRSEEDFRSDARLLENRFDLISLVIRWTCSRRLTSGC